MLNSEKLFQQNPFGRTRGHVYKIEKQHCRLNLRKEFFAIRVIDKWNSLPGHVVESQSTNMFKTALEKFLC